MILVTGGSGLLGAELIRQLLQSGKRVRALVNQKPLSLPSHPMLEQARGSILDVMALEEAMQGVEDVYHCAALVSFDPGDDARLYKINVEGTANLVNAALDAGVRRFAFVSSVAALGRHKDGVPVDESMNWSKETHNSRYGQSKYLAEMEVWRGMAEGLNAVVVNPSVIIGPGDWNSSSTAIFKSVYNGFPWYSEGVNGFVDVRDVAKAMILLTEKDIFGERFILNGHHATYKSVFELMAKAFGKNPPHRKVTPFLAGLVWRWEKIKSKLTGTRPLVTKETAETALAKVEYRNDKLLKALPGFIYTGLEESIAFTCKELSGQFHNPKA